MLARILVFLFFISPICLIANEYEEAFIKAKKEGKHVLLFFTGSDWSGWSMKMKKEILDTADFSQKTKEHFLIVEIEFPEHKMLSNETVAFNNKLKEKWNIHDYPRLVLVDEKESELARFAYPEKGPDKFADELIKIVERDRYLTNSMADLETSMQLSDLYKLARELKRENEANAIIEAGVKKGNATFLLEKYRLLVEEGHGSESLACEIREKIQQIDLANEKGMLFSMALIDFQWLARACKTPSEVAKPLEEYLTKFGEKDHENKWRLEMIIAQVYLNFDEWQKALQHAEVAFNSAPTEKKAEIGHSLDYIRQEAHIALK